MAILNWFRVEVYIQGSVAKTSHSLIKMIYCFGVFLDSQHIKVKLPMKKTFTSILTNLPCIHPWFKDSCKPKMWQQLPPKKILFSLTSVLCLSWCYRCHCPPQFDGPDCQQTRLSFLGNGYAWLPPIRPCFDSHLSLEFMTAGDDGLLLYAGPLTTLLPGDAEDYMAIGIRALNTFFFVMWVFRSPCELLFLIEKESR